MREDALRLAHLGVGFVYTTACAALNTLDNVEGLTPSGYLAGDLGFDPLGLGEGKMEHMAEAQAMDAPN